MDAKSLIQTLAEQESDPPMSIDLMLKLLGCGAIKAPELRVHLGVAETGVYRYTERTELRYGQLLNMFRHAKDDRVREMILEDLLPGTGYVVTRLPEALDINGDGDVDTHDALGSVVETIDQASTALKVLLHSGDDAGRYIDARHALKDAAEKTLAALAVVDYLQKHQPVRRKAKEVAGG